MDHQILMCEYLLENNGGLLFCEMRTGKTLGAILFLIEIRLLPILIIAPSNAMKNWHNWMIAQGFNPDAISMVDGSRKQREKEMARNCPIVITNYEMSLTYRLKYLKDWKVLLFDELYRLAHINANVTQYWIRGERPQDQIRIGVTGEPAPENALNFATEYMIIMGSFMGYDSYMQYYLANWQKNQYTGKDEMVLLSHETEIRDYVQTTAHCVTMESLGLGSIILYNESFFELNSRQEKFMKEVMALRLEGSKLVGIPIMENPFKIKAATRERVIAAGLDPDTHEVINSAKQKFILEAYLEAPEPIVVLSDYKAPLFHLEKMLQKKGIKYGIIHGKSGTSTQKEEVVDRFKAGEFNIILGQERAVKFNFDFSRASLTYYLTNSRSQDDRSQSSKRTINLNKSTPVGIMDLSYTDTLDHAWVKRLKNKGDISYSFIDRAFEDLTKRKFTLKE